MKRSLFLTAVLTLVACDAAQPPPTEVRIVDEVTVEGDELVLPRDTSVRPGDVVVAATGAGVLRRVEEVHVGDDGQLRLSTSPAVLTDVVENGHLSLRFGTQPGDGVILLEPETQSAIFDANIPIGDVALVDDEKLSIRISDGFVRFAPDFAFDMDISWGQLDEVTALLTGELDSEMDVSISAQGPVTVTGETLLVTPYAQDFTVWLGPIPVTGELRIDIMAGYQVSTDAVGAIAGRIGISADIAAGARYQDDAWAPVWEPNMDFALKEISQFDLRSGNELIGQVYLRPVATLRLYDQVGPYVWVKPYLEAIAHVLPAPGYDLFGGVTGHVGIDAEVQILSWDVGAQYDYQFVDERWPLASGSAF